MQVTVSTVGLVPQLRHFVENSPAQLAVSLHATTDQVCFICIDELLCAQNTDCMDGWCTVFFILPSRFCLSAMHHPVPTMCSSNMYLSYAACHHIMLHVTSHQYQCRSLLRIDTWRAA